MIVSYEYSTSVIIVLYFLSFIMMLKFIQNLITKSLSKKQI